MISTNPHYVSGRKKFESQDFEGALHDYTRAIEQEENPAIYSERAVVWYYLKKSQESLADMDYAAELEPENPYRYSSRAYIKDWIGDLEGAIKDYERAIELDPDDAIAMNNLGLLQEKMGYKDKAKLSFSKADALVGVDDDVLDRIRKENKALYDADKRKGTVENRPSEEREMTSIFALLRVTFTSKQGWKDYVDFIRNGFRIRS